MAATTTIKPTKIEDKTINNLFSFLISSSFICFTETASSSSSLFSTLIAFSTCFVNFLLSLSNSGYWYSNFGSFKRDSSKQVFKSSYISRASLYLFLGFLAALFKITFSTLCGISGNSSLILGSGSFKCFKAISTALSPRYGNWPTNNSYIKIPME